MTTTALEPLETKRITLGLIDEPDNPTREKMSPEGLERLGEQLLRVGQFQPIAVEQRGERYTIIFGHRRYVASKQKGIPTIRCDVYPAGVDRALVMQAGENANREKVNPAEEGDWLDDLYVKQCAKDLDTLCALVGLSPDYVGQRLLLVRGDPRLKQAVKDKTIAMGVALELNKIKSPTHRDYYITHAIQGGANLRLAKLWRSQADMMAATDAAPATPATDPGAATPASPAIVHTCVCCRRSTDVHEMEYVQVHRYCNKAILEPLLAAQRGEHA